MIAIRQSIVLIIGLIFTVACSDNHTPIKYPLQYGDTNTDEEAMKRHSQIQQLVDQSDLRFLSNYNESYTLIKKDGSSGVVLSSFSQLENFVSNHKAKDFIAVTIGKNVMEPKEVDDKVSTLVELFERAGYRRILINQAGGGLSGGIYVDQISEN